MKFKFLKLQVVIFVLASLIPANAKAELKPEVISFQVYPDDLNLTYSNSMDIKISVRHNLGIENKDVQITITDGRTTSFSTLIPRTSTQSSLTSSEVTFHGKILIPTYLAPGNYDLIAGPIKQIPINGLGYDTGLVNYNAKRDLIGAEQGIIIRKNGFANLSYSTLNGPTYEPNSLISFVNTSKYNNNNPPIWRKNEVLEMSDYFESPVKSIPFFITSYTDEVCKVDKTKLFLLNEGICKFDIESVNNEIYQKRKISQQVNILSPRSKQVIPVPDIENQIAKNLPKTLSLSNVWSNNGNIVYPISETPDICNLNLNKLQITSGGICKISYFSDGSSNYLPSEIIVKSIKIIREKQTIDFPLPSKINLSEKKIVLNSTSSSGGIVKFKVATPKICELGNNSLSLLAPGICLITAIQSGSSDFDPVELEKSIQIEAKSKGVSNDVGYLSCVKKGSRKITKFKLKECPSGYVKNRTL